MNIINEPVEYKEKLKNEKEMIFKNTKEAEEAVRKEYLWSINYTNTRANEKKKAFQTQQSEILWTTMRCICLFILFGVLFYQCIN